MAGIKSAFGKLMQIDSSIKKAEFQESNIAEVGHILTPATVRRVKGFTQFNQLVETVIFKRLREISNSGGSPRTPTITVRKMLDPLMNEALFENNDVYVEFYEDVMTSKSYTFVLKTKANGAEQFRVTVHIE